MKKILVGNQYNQALGSTGSLKGLHLKNRQIVRICIYHIDNALVLSGRTPAAPVFMALELL